jgi:hypothetical protein
MVPFPSCPPPRPARRSSRRTTEKLKVEYFVHRKNRQPIGLQYRQQYQKYEYENCHGNRKYTAVVENCTPPTPLPTHPGWLEGDSLEGTDSYGKIRVWDHNPAPPSLGLERMNICGVSLSALRHRR